jgi:hypothetical protein
VSVSRSRAQRDAGPHDRSSTAHRQPGQTPVEVEARVCALLALVIGVEAGLADTPPPAANHPSPASNNPAEQHG